MSVAMLSSEEGCEERWRCAGRTATEPDRACGAFPMGVTVDGLLLGCPDHEPSEAPAGSIARPWSPAPSTAAMSPTGLSPLPGSRPANTRQ
jgi:hypothetical protein